MWWRTFLLELGLPATGATAVRSDSQGSIALANNPRQARSKHIDIRHHFVREQVAADTVTFEYVPTELMLADVMTKPLSWDKHTWLLEGMGVHAASSAVGVLR
jgi:hypothetical protein